MKKKKFSFFIFSSKLSPLMSEKWHQFFLDREAENFLEESFKTSNAICLQAGKLI